MTHSQVAKRVRETKEKYPWRFCPVQGCLWNTSRDGGGYCPRHRPSEEQAEAEARARGYDPNDDLRK